MNNNQTTDSVNDSVHDSENIQMEMSMTIETDSAVSAIEAGNSEVQDLGSTDSEKKAVYQPSLSFGFLGEEGSEIQLPVTVCDEELLTELKSIPDKMGFKIGDVAQMLGIKQYVLRYWESEFDILKPKKAANNQRYYTKKDVENAYVIRKLLHRDRFSIEGAKGVLKDFRQHVKTELKKDHEFVTANTKISNLSQEIQSLLGDVLRLKDLFRI